MKFLVRNLVNDIERLSDVQVYGRVAAVQGMLIEAGGVQRQISVGDRCHVVARDGHRVPCEAVGFRNGRALLMPFVDVNGVGLGCRTEVQDSEPVVYPERSWLGRVINAFAQPVDGLGALGLGDIAYPIRNRPPPAA